MRRTFRMNRYRATMTLKGLEVVLKVGTRDECIAAIRQISGTPGITRVGMERVKDADNSRS